MRITFRRGKVIKKKNRIEPPILLDLPPSLLEGIGIYEWFMVSFIVPSNQTSTDPTQITHINMSIKTEPAKIEKVFGYRYLDSPNQDIAIYEVVVSLPASVKPHKKEILCQIKNIFKKNSKQNPPIITIKFL